MPGRAASVLTNIDDQGRMVLTLSGRLDSFTSGRAWKQISEVLKEDSPQKIIVDVSGIEYADGTGVGLLTNLRIRQLKLGGEVEITGLRDELRRHLDLFDPYEFWEIECRDCEPVRIPEQLGAAAVWAWDELRGFISFTGEVSVALCRAIMNPRAVRWRDVLLVAEKAGANALPIIALISFLVGLIMAFQGAIPMKQFGVEIYVADLIALSVLRELGPLMTAIIIAGRSGSAFAAEIGTMKVNEEIDALSTMGLDPVRFLVITRVLAALVVTPLLTVFADIIGLIGGSIPILSMGYPLVSYINHALNAADYGDLLGGLLKSLVFGVMIAGIGCLQGLRTRTGASAVGDSATRAVVTGLIGIVVVDGVFAVVYYYLGI